MAAPEDRTRFRLIPSLVAPALDQPWVSLAILVITGIILGVSRWADADGEATARFRVVASAGVGLRALVDTSGAIPLGGYPLDAVLALPLVWLHGSWAPVTGTIWVMVAGVSAAWLVGSWWGSEIAGVVGGVLWQVATGGALTRGDTASLVAFALLPLAWGLTIRALDRGLLALLLAGIAAGALVAVSGPESRSFLLLLAGTAGVGARQVGARAALPRLAGIVAIGGLLALPAFALRSGVAGGADLIRLPLVVAAILSLLTLRRSAARALLPVLAVLAGLGPVHGDSATVLGLVVLAAGVVPRLAQLSAAALARREAALAKT